MNIVGYGTKIVTTSNTRYIIVHTGNGKLSVLPYGFKRGHGYGLLVGIMLMPINTHIIRNECNFSVIYFYMV